MAFGGNNQSGPIDVATARNACGSGSGSGSGRLDFETETFLVQPVAATLDASYGRLQGCSGQDASHGHSHLVPIAFDSRQDPVSSTAVFGALGSSSPQAQSVAYGISNQPTPNFAYELSPPLDAKTSGGGRMEAVCITGDVTHTLKAEGFDAREDGTGRGQPIVAAVALRGREGGATAELGDDVAGCLRASGDGGDKAHALVGAAVRRLTPVECERLQYFPDNYTFIPSWNGWRKMDASETPESCIAAGLEIRQNKKTGKWRVKDVDGPRYKALGNSWVVSNVRWFGVRIDAQLRAAHGSVSEPLKQE